MFTWGRKAIGRTVFLAEALPFWFDADLYSVEPLYPEREEAAKTCYFGNGHAECSTCRPDACPWYAEIEEEAQR